MPEALRIVARLDPHDRERRGGPGHSTRLLTDSRSGLQQLQRGPTAQATTLAAEVWRLLQFLFNQGADVFFQWVPGHAGPAGNEAADRLASRRPRETSPLPPSILPAPALPSPATSSSWRGAWPASPPHPAPHRDTTT